MKQFHKTAEKSVRNKNFQFCLSHTDKLCPGRKHVWRIKGPNPCCRSLNLVAQFFVLAKTRGKLQVSAENTSCVSAKKNAKKKRQNDEFARCNSFKS